ncbi:MAG: hypothetical protein HGA96_16980, partial [Desulfobulbaceae bacterium]|nr:hypothetical protein [Desulfobulbaceae bacterium]
MRYLAGIATLVACLLSASGGEAYFIDTPHNESNGISCLTCHDSAPMYVTDWAARTAANPDDTMRNAICLMCHDEVSTDPLRGPTKKLHASSTLPGSTTWSTECTQCHEIHAQGQLDWSSNDFDPDKLFLASGSFETIAASGGAALVYNAAGNYTTVGISATIAGELPWIDTSKWNAKGGNIDPARAVDGSRGLILVPNKSNPNDTYEIIEVTPTNVNGIPGYLLKVKGQMTGGIIPGQVYGIIYGQSLKSMVMPNGGTTTDDYRDVKFFVPDLVAGTYGGLVDLTPCSPAPLGLCQVCHTETIYWSSGMVCSDPFPPPSPHYPTTKCSVCHDLINPIPLPDPILHGLKISNYNSGGVNCASCHAFTEPVADLHGAAVNVVTLGTGCQACHNAEVNALNSDVAARLGVTPAFGDDGSWPVNCAGCHPEKPNGHPIEVHSEVDFGWDGNCADCHAGTNIVADVHSSTCSLCHDTSGANGYTVRKAGDASFGVDGTAVGATTTTTCTGCHNTQTSGAIHHTSKNGLAAGSCTTSCHGTASHKGNHVTAVAGYLNCTSCHLGNVGGDATVGAPVDAVNTLIHDDCYTCHNTDATLKSLAQVGGSKVIAMPNPSGASTDGGGSCFNCHGEYFSYHQTAHQGAYVPILIGCTACHNSTGVGTARRAVTQPFTGTGQVHEVGGCYACHQTTGLLRAGVPDVANLFSCEICHLSGSTTWATIHGPAAISHTTTVTVNANCSGCHSGTTPGVSTLAKDAVTSPFLGSGEVHNSAGCATCHNSTSGAILAPYGRAVAIAAGSCSTCHINGSTKTWSLVHGPNVTYTTAEHLDLITTGSCANCHGNPTPVTSNARDAQVAPYIVAGDVHAGGCTLCHNPSNGDRIVGGNGKGDASVAAGADNKWECAECHAATWAVAHTARVGVDHTGRAGGLAACTTCHDGTAGNTLGVMPVSVIDDKVHDDCLVCHTADGALKSGATVYGAQAIAKGDCGTCHGATYFDSHVHGTTGGYVSHDVAYNPALDQAENTWNPCATCHIPAGLLTTWTGIANEHNNCATCHSYTNADGLNSPPLPANNSAIAGGVAVHCVTCHTEKAAPAGHAPPHPDLAWTPDSQLSCGAANCHDYLAHPDVIRDIHGDGANATCGVCHVDPGGGGSRRVTGNADATAGAAGSDCMDCHLAAPREKGGIHHDTEPASNNNCTTSCHQVVDHSLHIVDSSSCNALFCHANPNFDGSNDSAAGTLPVATLIDLSNPMKHDSCRTCHTFDPTTLAGTLNGSTGAKGITTLVAGPCEGCHTQAVNTFHHLNVNASIGACTLCHFDPRNDNNPLTPDYDNKTPPAGGIPTQLPCDECHVTPVVNPGGFTGSMTISAWNEGGTHTRVSYATDFTRTVANTASGGTGHVIPNTAGKIDNWGICFGCHDGVAPHGKAVSDIKPLHPQPTGVGTCNGTYTPANGKSMGRFFFLGTSWRPATTQPASSSGNGTPATTNCSTKQTAVWASANSGVGTGIRGAVSSLTIPDPWGTSTRVVPVWTSAIVRPLIIIPPPTVDIKVSSAEWYELDGTLTVQATTTGICSNLTLVNGKGNVNFSGSGTCVATVAAYAYPANGTTVAVVDNTTDSLDVNDYRISLKPEGPPLCVIAEDYYTVPASGTTNLPVLANDTCPGSIITGLSQPSCGLVAIAGGGTSIDYTGAGSSCVDSFTYTITASDASTVVATVTLMVVGDSTVPVVGTVLVTPTVGSATSSAPTITATLTDNESPVTACTYTTNGSTYVAGVLSGSSSPWTCTASPSGLSGSLTINVRGVSSGGTGTGSSVARTVDLTGPSDGVLTAIPGDATVDLTWTAASDAGLGLRATNTYDVRVLAGGSTYPTCSSGTSIYSGTGLAFTHTGLTNGLPYYYRVCAYDAADNVSIGATANSEIPPPPTHDFTWTPAMQTSCGTANCHNSAVNSDVFTDLHGNGTEATCGVCHVDPGGGGSRRVTANGDATAGTGTSECIACHLAAPRVKGGIHHDTEPASNNNCTTSCHQVVDHSLHIVDSSSCNALFCHANPNFDGSNDSAAGTLPVATLIDLSNPMKHDSCRTCHTFDPTTLAGTLNGSTGAKGITTLVAGPCEGCHTQAVNTFHHLNVNASIGACTLCHFDPRNDNNPLTPDYDNKTPPAGGIPTQLPCDECHVTPVVNPGGFTGSMTISAWNEGGTHTRVSYATDFTRTVANTASGGTGHVIPNTAGKIDNWGICFGCHDGVAPHGKAVSDIKPLHPQPTGVGTCNGTYTPANGKSMGRFFFLGTSWRPATTQPASSSGNGTPATTNCSTKQTAVWASANSGVGTGIRGAVSSLTIPDPWGTSTRVVPVWTSAIVRPLIIIPPPTVDIKVSSAEW